MSIKQDDLTKWKNRIEWARESTKSLREDWKRSVKLFEAKKENIEDIIVPTIFSTFSVSLPTLFSSLPKITANAKSQDMFGRANFVEKIIEDISEKTGLYDEIFQAVYSSRIKGIGYVKLGFNAELEEVPILDEALGLLYLVAKGEKTLTNEIVTEESVWIDYVKAEDIFLDPEAEKFESCRFIAHRIILTKTEIEKRFPGIGIAESAIKRCTDSCNEKLANYMKDSDSERYEIYEIWSKEEGRRYVVAEGYDKFLENEPWPHNLKDYPFEMLVLTPSLDSLFGINEVLLNEDAASTVNSMAEKQEDNAERSRSMTIFERGALEEDQLKILQNPGNKKWVEVNDISLIRHIETPSVPQEVYALKAEMERQIHQTSQISAQQRQATNPGKQTATEIQAIEQSGNVIKQFKVRRIELFIERIVRKLITLVKQYYDQPQLVKLDGKFGDLPVFEEWVGSDIGEWTFKVKAGSAAYQNEAIKTQQIMQALEQIRGFAGEIIPNPTPLAKELLRSSFDMLGVNPDIVKQAFEPEGNL